jgi:replicative DNA helicase
VAEQRAKKDTETTVERRVPPHSLEAEVAVLGGLLRFNEELPGVRQLVDATMFYLPQNQMLFGAFCALYNARRPIDIITVRDALKTAGKWEDVGGTEYLERLVEETHTKANLEHYAHIIVEKYRLRQLVALCFEIEGEAFGKRAAFAGASDPPRTADQLCGEIVQRILRQQKSVSLSAPIPLSRAVEQAVDWAEQRQVNPGPPGLRTGFRDLDEALGGILAEEFVVIGGRPGMGKSAFAVTLALYTAHLTRRPVYYATLEMSARQTALRILTSFSRIPAKAIRFGNMSEEQWKTLIAAAGTLDGVPLFLDESEKISAHKVGLRARSLKAEQGDLALVVVDYLQLMDIDEREETREREVATISRELKLLTKGLHCPVIAVCQLNRELERRTDKRPAASDLRESGSLEQDADKLLFLYRDVVYNSATTEPRKCEILVRKNRDGQTGSVPLYFDPATMLFQDYVEATRWAK